MRILFIFSLWVLFPLFTFAQENEKNLLNDSSFYTIEIPNSFSPNGDNKNDIWYISGDNIRTASFKIFSRWGGVIYESENFISGWDGTTIVKKKQALIALRVFTIIS